MDAKVEFLFLASSMLVTLYDDAAAVLRGHIVALIRSWHVVLSMRKVGRIESGKRSVWKGERDNWNN